MSNTALLLNDMDLAEGEPGEVSLRMLEWARWHAVADGAGDRLTAGSIADAMLATASAADVWHHFDNSRELAPLAA